MRNQQHISLAECEDRRLYRIHSRNLLLGVFTKATHGFIGIREKFRDRYLFEEYHYDTGAPFGTALPYEALPDLLPEGIQLLDSLGTICRHCRVGAEWTKTDPEKETGVWRHMAPTDCTEVYAVVERNLPLFAWMDEREALYLQQEPK